MTRLTQRPRRRGRAAAVLFCGAAVGAFSLSGCAAARRTVAKPVVGVMRAVPGVRRFVPAPAPAPVRHYVPPTRTAPPAPTGPIRGGWDPAPGERVEMEERYEADRFETPADPFAPPAEFYDPADAAVHPPAPTPPGPVNPVDDPAFIAPAEPTVRRSAPVDEPPADPNPEAADPPPAPAAPLDENWDDAEAVPELPADAPDDDEGEAADGAFYPVGVSRNPLAALFRSLRGETAADRRPAAGRPAAPAAADPRTVLVAHQAPAARRAVSRPAVRLGAPVFDADPADAPLWTPAAVAPAAVAPAAGGPAPTPEALPVDPFAPPALPAPFPRR